MIQHQQINNKPSNHSQTSHTNNLSNYFFITLFPSLELLNMDKSTHNQFSLLPNTYYKKIHEFHIVNKGFEIHLPQIVEQSLRDLSLPISLSFWISLTIQIINHKKFSKLNNTHFIIGLALSKNSFNFIINYLILLTCQLSYFSNFKYRFSLNMPK